MCDLMQEANSVTLLKILLNHCYYKVCQNFHKKLYKEYSI